MCRVSKFGIKPKERGGGYAITIFNNIVLGKFLIYNKMYYMKQSFT